MSITRPRGFRAVGLAAGLKASGAPDLAVVLNDGPRDTAAAVFTANRVQAAPVLWSRQAVADGRARAVILNSGGANACTGPEGFADTHRTAEHLAAELAVDAQDVLVCSTGLIGERLPMEPLLAGATAAVAGLDAGTQADESAARAIMTTDTVPKTAEATTASGVVVGGIAKGAGMLAPQLATMLVVLTTDADVDAATAEAALRAATATTFDRVDSDACMSTNDTVLLLASGASGIAPSLEELTEAVRVVSADLARQLVADAEGASHDVHVVVRAASTEQAALAVAREIARSNLVKAAVFGNDPNWGRIVAAAGCVPEAIAPFDVAELSVHVNGVEVCRGGGAHRDRSEVDMTPRETLIEVDLGAGTATGDIWTNDLTHDYVEENSAYSS
ncbi:bifunctional glutamate N-acetyltransferase/amino-acid acetyltransferase ArgJ [Brachybacterium saurashtrense]|uniref:Arginine biosynthesis bifunctional protein ArgJ n=1 Tax=Brachybacterium saurashtrense TaxID=556288 RepID=A0A345YNV6_9MICO|nr:bifunctional glutamate N-acetyltransferase/amino-acid acetyltransferase ArgJ [Brachybacterium saurashtrense]AXK45608.1 bifunctional glutamate N-acetyltransferase/amino-acid acetyltransferase ArgJ [Brachybacterium saurashtrense]RRR24625.1 bifunctional glutamate N-acetyltransferase/amino-acid acetyltransferase ArgJ [Brachybacterium saurashtrense]